MWRHLALLSLGLAICPACGGDTSSAHAPVEILPPSEPAEWHPPIAISLHNLERLQKRYRDTLTSGLEDEE